MNRQLIKIILMLFWFANSGNISAQKKYATANSEALASFLNMPEIIKSFRHQKPKDSTLVILDRNNDFQPNSITDWNGQIASVIYDSSVSRQLKKVYPFALFKERCSYYIIMEFSRKENSYTFDLLQPCSGLITTGTVKKTKGVFRLVNINRGVL